MRRYEQVSGALFGMIAAAQLTRTILQLPAQVGTTSIPVWWSAIACLAAGSLAIWAFRATGRTA